MKRRIIAFALTVVVIVGGLSTWKIEVSAEEQPITGESGQTTRGIVIEEVYLLARMAYNTGIAFVIDDDCMQTAEYMEHAAVPYIYADLIDYTPSSIVHDNDSWAQGLIANRKLQEDVLAKIKEQGTSEGTVFSECFEFSVENGATLEQFTALNKVSYIADYVKTKWGYEVSYTISDVFDFEYDTFDSIKIEFANNYCAMMMENEWIKEFDITIYATGEILDFEASEDEIAIPLTLKRYGKDDAVENVDMVIYIKKNSRFSLALEERANGDGTYYFYSSEPCRYKSSAISSYDGKIFEFSQVCDRPYLGMYGASGPAFEVDISYTTVLNSNAAAKAYTSGKISWNEATNDIVDGEGVKVVLTSGTEQHHRNINFAEGARNAIVTLPNGRFVIYSSQTFTIRDIFRKRETGAYISSYDQTFTLNERYGYVGSNTAVYDNIEVDGEVWTNESDAVKYVRGY